MIDISVTKPLLGQSGEMELSVDLEIENGSFVAIVGPSGSGKTTFLRILAGVEEAKGKIAVDDEQWLGAKIVPPQKRRVGFVFQDYALFENMTVVENLLYVRSDKSMAKRLLDTMGITELSDRYPPKLSGGQKQRVALARAMMNEPKILLLDEPLSALDPQIRIQLRDEILKLHKEFGTTTLMVTHDVREVAQMANRVIKIEQGTVVFDGNVGEYMRPDIIEGKWISQSENSEEVRLALQTHKGELLVVAKKIN